MKCINTEFTGKWSEFIFLCMRQPSPEESFFDLRPRKRDQRIDIALSGDGAVEYDGADGDGGAEDEAPDV